MAKAGLDLVLFFCLLVWCVAGVTGEEVDCDHIIVGMGPAGCSVGYKLYKETDDVVCMAGAGGDVEGDQVSQQSIWGHPTVGIPARNPEVHDRYTTVGGVSNEKLSLLGKRPDAFAQYFPFSLPRGGGGALNPGVLVPQTADYWDALCQHVNYPSWCANKMLEAHTCAINTPELINITTPMPEPMTEIITRFIANEFGASYYSDGMLNSSRPAGAGPVSRYTNILSGGTPQRSNPCTWIKKVQAEEAKMKANKRRLKVFDYTVAGYVNFKSNPKHGKRVAKSVTATNMQTHEPMNFKLKNADKGTVILASGASGNVMLMEKSGLGNCTYLEHPKFRDGPIDCVVDNKHVGSNFKAAFNSANGGMRYTLPTPSNVNRSSGNSQHLYARSSVALGPLTDLQIGILFVTSNSYSFSCTVNQYKSNNGFLHLRNAGSVLQNPVASYGAGTDTVDSEALLDCLVRLYRAAEKLAPTLGLPLTSPTFASPVGSEAYNNSIRASLVTQYHDQATHSLGKVVDEHQRFIGTANVLAIGGGVLPEDYMMRTHGSQYFAMLSGCKASKSIINNFAP